MYQLKIKLKQHTPIIHFETGHDLATLRPSELKPKLDALLRSKLPEIPETWQVGNEKRIQRKVPEFALDYKINLIINNADYNKDKSGPISYSFKNNKTQRYQPQKFPCYFAEMGANNKNDKFFTFYNSIDLIITCKHEKLLEEINKLIPIFFISTNFGSRQSKGFGSYYPANTELFPIPEIRYYFDIDVNGATKPNLAFNNTTPSLEYFKLFSLFKAVNLFYNSIRSGINQPFGKNTFYLKSLLFNYTKDFYAAKWDKRMIKEKMFFPAFNQHQVKFTRADPLFYNSHSGYLMRDLLGLATTSKWGRDYYDATISKKHTEDIIKRFKSPITIKPIEISRDKYRIYIILDQKHQDKILNKEFILENSRNLINLTLSTPTHFDLKAYLQFAIDQNIALNAELGNKSMKHPDLNQLIQIFNQLKNNINIVNE